MKTRTVIATVLLVTLFACSPKASKSLVSNNQTGGNDCKDTSATIVFINTKKVEQRVSILIESSAMEGNVLVHSYNKFKNNPVKAGDSVSFVLSIHRKYMYEVYGPVSTNVNGLGVVAEKKFVLQGCQRLRESI